MEIDLKKLEGACSCQREHHVYIDKILLEDGAVEKLPLLLKDTPFQNLVMICDENTYEIAGKQTEQLLHISETVMLKGRGIHADETSVAYVMGQLRGREWPDALITVGSGTLHDITRYCAFDLGIPFISVPTAASVDGYTSTVAAMTLQGFKKTVPSCAPMMIAADSRILMEAPLRLTASGVGDLLGKYTALADWKLAHLLTGEYFCPRVCGLEEEALEIMCRSLPGLKKGEISAFEQLMYGLLLSGLAIQMVGNSRPASGTEHHMSHLWEMEAVNPCIDFYHGEKVGTGLVISSEIYHKAAECLRDGRYSIRGSVPLEKELIRKCFAGRGLNDIILEENQPNLLDQISPSVLREKEGRIIEILEQVPKAETLRAYLDEAGGVSSLEDLGLEKGMKALTARVSPYVRQRLTFMRILKYYDFYESVIQG